MFDNNKVQAAIARYSEDLSWVSDLECHSIIYNKGQSTFPGALLLPNIGRESHTYITHIIDNYSDLPEFTVFLQGSPFFHMEEGADCATLNSFNCRSGSTQCSFQRICLVSYGL